MDIEEFGLSGGLSKEQIDMMHEKAIELVEEVGVQIPHEGILKLLSGHDGVSIEGDTVRFRSNLLRCPGLRPERMGDRCGSPSDDIL